MLPVKACNNQNNKETKIYTREVLEKFCSIIRGDGYGAVIALNRNGDWIIYTFGSHKVDDENDLIKTAAVCAMLFESKVFILWKGHDENFHAKSVKIK